MAAAKVPPFLGWLEKAGALYGALVAESVEVLERRIDGLRAAVRQAVVAGEPIQANALRADLHAAERAWEHALAVLMDEAESRGDRIHGAAEERQGHGRTGVWPGVVAGAATEVPSSVAQPARQSGPLVPMREQVHQALTLLSVPAAPKLIVEVYTAFFGAGAGDGGIADARLTHLRRDEERSFRTSPYSRPYYLCSALTADHLVPARGLLAVSTWPLEKRVVGPLSPRVDFLTAAINVAEYSARMPGNANVARLLWRFAVSISGAGQAFGEVESEVVVTAAKAELHAHNDADRSHREAAAARARRQLDDVEQLFGSRLRMVRGTG